MDAASTAESRQNLNRRGRLLDADHDGGDYGGDDDGDDDDCNDGDGDEDNAVIVNDADVDNYDTA